MPDSQRDVSVGSGTMAGGERQRDGALGRAAAPAAGSAAGDTRSPNEGPRHRLHDTTAPPSPPPQSPQSPPSPPADASPPGPPTTRALSPGEPLPRWFVLLPLLTLALWWPIAPYWASDDYFALNYARDLGRALADFAGPQYGAPDLFFFYRPLITLSHWLDVQLGGGTPFCSHLFNVVVHAVNALLAGCLWRRLLPDRLAFAAGLLYAIAPSHIGSIGWAAGRTDAIAALFGQLCILMLVRWREGRQRTRLPSLLAMLAGLLSKETLLCLPGLAAIVAFALGDGGVTGRLRAAVRGSWPHALLLGAYLAWRIHLFGRIGGYDAAVYEPSAMLLGLGRYAFDLVDPLHWTAPALVLPAAIAGAPALPWLGALPALVAGIWCARRRTRWGPAGLALVWFLCGSVPLAGFWADPGSHHNLRYFALAFVGWCGLLVAAGPAVALGTLCLFAPGFVQMRCEQFRADDASARMHGKLLDEFGSATPGPWFVAGLPHTSPSGNALQFHFGIDRMLEPPFGPGGLRVYAHRPFFDVPGAVHLQDSDDLPCAPPAGTTYLFRGPGLLTTIPPRPLAELPLRCDDVVDLTSPRLLQLASKQLAIRIATPGVHTEALRLVFFTATGYLGAVTPNHAPKGAADGEIDLLQFFGQANWRDAPARLIDALTLPVTIDVLPEFPVWIEGGQIQNGAFVPTHRARRLVTFRFDRGLPATLRG